MTQETTGLPALSGTTAVATRVPVGKVLGHAARKTMDSTTGVICAVTASCVGIVSWAGGSLLGGAIVMVVMVMAMTAWRIIAAWTELAGESAREAERRAKKGERARSKAAGLFNSLMGERVEEWYALNGKLRALIEDKAAVDVADDVSIRLCSLSDAFEQAIADAGRSDTSMIETEAANTALALVQSAVERHAEIDQRIRTVDQARAPDVTRRFSETARAVAGLPSMPSALPPPSASAALQRLIGLAEDALAVDPDLVDRNGARVDALVRQHLPRLLSVHADAARSSASDLTAVDARLEEGVEEVRASIEEALAKDAQARFDRLSTEVSFLRMRRGA